MNLLIPYSETNMRLLFITALTFLSLNFQAQTLSSEDDKNIRERLDKYLELTKDNKFMEMMDYVYPKLFTFVTKEQMAQVFTSMESMGIKLFFDGAQLLSLKPLVQINDKAYAYIHYSTDIRLELLTEEMQNAEVVESLKNSFKATYNTEEVSYDAETRMISLKGYKYIIAIYDPDYSDDRIWYFLEFDENNIQMNELLLGQDVFNKLLDNIK